jgi:hypothetical protein
MATGDSDDIVARQKRALPQGWFADAAPVRDSVLAGFAAVGIFAYALIQSVKSLMRIGTSFAGWLEVTALDYFGPGQFPRQGGETDSGYAARIQAALLPKANTRGNIHDALVILTGNPVRMIEPWDPRDCLVWGGAHSFWGVNTKTNPGQWANGNQRDAGLVVCMLPTISSAGAGSRWIGWGQSALGGGFWGNSVVGGVIALAWSAGTSAATAASLVYALINRLRLVGVRVYVRFTGNPAELV